MESSQPEPSCLVVWCCTCVALEIVRDKIYSSADMSLTGIKRWKASVLTYWTAPLCPAGSTSSPILMTAIVHLPRPKAHPVNIQMELTLGLHKIQIPNLLVIAVTPLPPACMWVCVRAPRHTCVCVYVCHAKTLTKTLNIILSGLQPWKQFSAPFRLLSWKLQTKAFWLQCKSLAYKGLPIQIRLCSAPRHRL